MITRHAGARALRDPYVLAIVRTQTSIVMLIAPLMLASLASPHASPLSFLTSMWRWRPRRDSLSQDDRSKVMRRVCGSLLLGQLHAGRAAQLLGQRIARKPRQDALRRTCRRFLAEDEPGRWHSQVGQDKTIAQLYAYKRGGFFVDCAANDPVALSNTRALERDFGWSGVCIEGNEKLIARLRKVRRCTVVAGVISGRQGERVNFTTPKGGGAWTYSSALGSIVDDAGSEPAFDRYKNIDRRGWEEQTRTTLTLEGVLDASGSPRVIDCELQRRSRSGHLHACVRCWLVAPPTARQPYYSTDPEVAVSRPALQICRSTSRAPSTAPSRPSTSAAIASAHSPSSALLRSYAPCFRRAAMHT